MFPKRALMARSEKPEGQMFADSTSLAETDSDTVAQTLEVLGSTTTSEITEKADVLVRREDWQLLFHSLPNEVIDKIMETLWTEFLDPVSQMCFGLTARRFWQSFHNCQDQFHDGVSHYPIKSRPFNFNMQISADGQMIFGWYEWACLRNCTDIVWQRSLGELLKDEQWLWANLHYCGTCEKYKPRNAYDGCEFEETMLVKHHHQTKELGFDTDWYLERCRRCRVKAIMIYLKDRFEVFERGNAFEQEDWASLGVSTGVKSVVLKSDDEEYWVIHESQHGVDKWGRPFESWTEVFERLNI